ncbi:SRPBCC domain-containing protein [Nonomuraea sp. NPDC047529]|uniref:SRPBCC domain-containing protein n=1 Tax=Nonomuraea sp. NPDC047529 TaxID=3155623 RepID=UPI0033DF9DC7
MPTYVSVTYIRASAEQVWRALTDADLTARYWAHANVSDWQPGSTWEHRIVRLTVTHENLPNQATRDGIAQGWPAVLANLKSLLETGEVLPQAPWEMHRAHA